MKSFLFLLIGFLSSASALAQEFISLKIDSSYYWSWSVGFEGDTSINESSTAYTYDFRDSLVQRRVGPSSINGPYRVNYAYAPDTVRTIRETRDSNGLWSANSRTTTIFHLGQIIQKLNEDSINNAWENITLQSYFFNAAGLDTLYLIQYWENGAWVNSYKKETNYDPHGNAIAVSEYYIDDNGVFEFSRGDLYAYDDMHHQIEQIHLNASINGVYYTDRTNRAFGNDDLLDSLRRCNYVYPSTTECRNIVMYAKTYYGSDSTREDGFVWLDEFELWDYRGREMTYNGEEIYSEQPDSVIYYEYLPDQDIHEVSRRQYYSYHELGNNIIAFKGGEYSLRPTGEWKLTRLREEWYHIGLQVGVEAVHFPSAVIDIYPNPSPPGQLLNLHASVTDQHAFEVFVFDLAGRLVSREYLNDMSAFEGPKQSGIYSIFVKQNGHFIATCKQVVID